MGTYRKYIEPEYGEAARYVEIPAPEIMDMEHPQRWRDRHVPESAAGILGNIRKTKCYEDLMKLDAVNLTMKHDGVEVPLRLYLPEKNDSCPVLVYYHGGGFAYNDFSVYEYVCRYIAAYGNALVISVGYRLAPEHKCPAAREDTYAALQWAYENAGTYGGDKNRISIAGDSAGGNLAAGTALMARDFRGPKIHKQILIYPITSFTLEIQPQSENRYGTGYFLEYKTADDPMQAYFEENDQEARRNIYNSPLLAKDLKELPSALFLSAECDPLLDQGLMYAARLQDAGVPVEYHIYKGMLHGFLNSTYEKSFECLDEICRALEG